MVCINDASSYWPKCDPSQTKNSRGPAGYEYGHYCTSAWTDAFNDMMSSPEVNKCHDRETITNVLAQVAYETAYFSTVSQPLDRGAGLIHMIPQNWIRNARDMDEIWPSNAYEEKVRRLGSAFFQESEYAWRSAAAWFLKTNEVIYNPICGTNLFEVSYGKMTRCILGRAADRSDSYNIVQRCMQNMNTQTSTSSISVDDVISTTSTSTTASPGPAVIGFRCGTSWGNANARCSTPCPSGTNAECTAPGESCFAGLTVACPTQSTESPTISPETLQPSNAPSYPPTLLSMSPSKSPEMTTTLQPTIHPTESPSTAPTQSPTNSPSESQLHTFNCLFGSCNPSRAQTCARNRRQQLAFPCTWQNKCSAESCISRCRSRQDCNFAFSAVNGVCILYRACVTRRRPGRPGVTYKRTISPPTENLTFQLRGKNGQEQVRITVDGETFPVVRLTKLWRTFSYQMPANGEFRLNFLNDNRWRNVYFRMVSDEDFSLSFRLFPDWKCGQANENWRCRRVRDEGVLAWGGEYIYSLEG